MAPLPRASSLPLFPTFHDSDTEDSPAGTLGGIAHFTMETTNTDDRECTYQSSLPADGTAEPLPGTRKRSESSASDSSDDSDKTVVPSASISGRQEMYTLSDSFLALLDTSTPATGETAHLESGTKKRSSSVSSHSSNASSPDSVKTVLPIRDNGHVGVPLSASTVETDDTTPEYHLPTEIEYPVHEGQIGYPAGMGYFRTSSDEHGVEYSIHGGQNDVAAHEGHSHSSSNASRFEAGLRRLSLSHDARDSSDSLKYLSPPTENDGHQRNVSRKSSYPSIPSPLGPKTFTDDFASDVSGLVPSASSITTPRSRGTRQISQPELSRRSLPMSTSPISLSEQLEMLKPAASTPYHRRQYTDPFIDNSGSGSGSPGLNYGSAGTSPLPPPGLDYGQHNTQATPFGTGAPAFEDPAAYYAQNPQMPTQAQRASNLTEQQKAALRKTWIADSAREIAALARRCATLEQQYQLSGTLADLQAVEKARKAFADATSLDRRVEQRRNLFMPAGMQAMRTTAENASGDGFGGSQMGGSQGGEGRLLGGEMAAMERICAEVLRTAEERRRKRGGA